MDSDEDSRSSNSSESSNSSSGPASPVAEEGQRDPEKSSSVANDLKRAENKEDHETNNAKMPKSVRK